ncbi:MAG: type I-E CRISPR-associated endoribonuclease Cas2 [Anaerolineae bacterium]|nr:type I-E CRISPR-associated endoribonuclease Cas2 [Anaerolineae bacterium]
MLVMVLENVPPSLRGELTRWLIEPRPGVFVGHVSALVRDRLWEKCIKQRKNGGLIQIWTTNTEQRFDLRTWGNTDREMVDFEGLWLVRQKKTSPPVTPPATAKNLMDPG